MTTTDDSAYTFEAPIDHEELLARIRFSLDDAMRLSSSALKARTEAFDECRSMVIGGAVRVTPKLMPHVHAAVRQTCDRLMIANEPDVFVEASAEPNAGALTDGKRHFIKLNSGLIHLLEPEELPAVIGHEFGHAFYRHMVEAPANESQEIFMLERRRAQEISADRAGLISVTDPVFALRAEMKVACGLGKQHLSPDIDAFIEQISVPPADLDAPWEAASTHPALALRFWAQRHFIESDVFLALTGKTGGRHLDEVEREIEERFHGTGSSMAFRATADHVHESLAWLGILLVATDNDVTGIEYAVLVEFVGKIWADDSYTYAKRHGLKAVERRALETLAPLRFANIRSRRRIEKAINELAQRAGAMDRVNGIMKLIEHAVQPE